MRVRDNNEAMQGHWGSVANSLKRFHHCMWDLTAAHQAEGHVGGAIEVRLQRRFQIGARHRPRRRDCRRAARAAAQLLQVQRRPVAHLVGRNSSCVSLEEPQWNAVLGLDLPPGLQGAVIAAVPTAAPPSCSRNSVEPGCAPGDDNVSSPYSSATASSIITPESACIVVCRSGDAHA